MNTFFIFGAKYLFVASIVLFIWSFLSVPKTERRKFTLYSIAIFAVSFILDVIAGKLYFNPRPFISDGIVPLIQHAADNGFPSDHTILAAAIAVIIGFFNRRLALYAWGLAVIVGLSRVYVGVHHMTDIIASIVIAIISGAVVYRVFRSR